MLRELVFSKPAAVLGSFASLSCRTCPVTERAKLCAHDAAAKTNAGWNSAAAATFISILAIAGRARSSRKIVITRKCFGHNICADERIDARRHANGDAFAAARLPSDGSYSDVSQDREPSRAQSMALHASDSEYVAYNEAAFRHFLNVERNRAVRLGGSLLLMLVEMNEERGGGRLQPALADRLFTALSGCVREIDFIGWYRMDRVIGAVLTQGSEGTSPEVCQQIGERAAAIMSHELPGDLRRRVQVRVLQLPTPPKERNYGNS